MQKTDNAYHFILVEDNEIDLFFHEKLLSLQGLAASIHGFSSAAKALQYISSFTHQVDQYPYSIILLDIQMPEMNGFDFLNCFEDLPEKLIAKNQVIMVSSSLDHADLRRSEAHPLVAGILKKPLDATELKQAIRRCLCPENRC